MIRAADPQLESAARELAGVRPFRFHAGRVHSEFTPNISGIEQTDAEREAAQVRCVVLDLRVERRPVITRTDAPARSAVPIGGRAAQLAQADAAADVVEDGFAVENPPAAAHRDGSERTPDVGLPYADVDIEGSVAVR